MRRGMNAHRFFQYVTKGLRFLLRGVGLFAGIYLLLSLVGGVIPVNQSYHSQPSSYPIKLFTTGIHLDICLPVSAPGYDWRADFPDMPATRPDDFISFGWGDRNFYLKVPVWDSLRPSYVTKALFEVSPSAMHVTWFKQAPTHALGYRECFVDSASYVRLCHFIQVTLTQDSTGACVRIDHESYPNLVDGFYEAQPAYQLFYTCNHWINEALQIASVRTSLWTPFDRLILYHID